MPDTTDKPKGDDTLSGALRAADRAIATDRAAEAAVTAATEVGATAPVFTTHSQGVLALIASQEMALREKVADVDAAIERLQAERTDLMLAFSMCEGARRARERGAG